MDHQEVRPGVGGRLEVTRATEPSGDVAEQAILGQREAFDQLVEEYTPLLLGFLVGRTADLADAEDVAQEVWLTAHRMLPTLRRADRMGPWLMRIARRRLADFYRERGRRPQVVWSVAEDEGTPDWTERVADASPDPAQRAQASQVRSVVIESIAWMKERYRVVLYMALFDECDAETIARRLGLKPGTVRMRLHRGLKILRRALTRRGVDG